MTYLKYILVLLLFNNTSIYSQEDYVEKMQSLINQATELDVLGDSIGVIETLIEVLEIDSSNRQIKKILSSRVRVNMKMLEREGRFDLLEKSSKYISSMTDYEEHLSMLINIYYEEGYNQKLEELLMGLVNKEPEELQIYHEHLYSINFEKNPEMALKIYKSMLPFIAGSPINALPFAYRCNDQERVQKIILFYDSIDVEKNYANLDFVEKVNTYLKEIDPNVNPNLFRQICDFVQPYLYEENRVYLLVKLYTIKDFTQFDYFLEESVESQRTVSSNDALNSILSLNPDINNERYKKLFSFLVMSLNEGDLDTITSTVQLYKLAKNLYVADMHNLASNALNKIYLDISANVQTFDKYIIWGISCLQNNEVYRATRFFDNVITFGTNNDRLKLRNDLSWWSSHDFKTDEINGLISQFYGENKIYESEMTNNYIDDRIVTESNHALLIAVEDYNNDRLDLKYPLSDAYDLFSVLTSKYSISASNTTFLKNPNRRDIISTFSKIRAELNENDNLIIFFAGHGYWDENAEQGYWLPSDADQGDPVNWISNSDVRVFVKSLKNKHTLLISDACFSGGIFKTREAFLDDDKHLEEIYNMQSRRAITSGYMKEVPDKSVFMEYFIKALNENQNKYLTSQKLYLLIRDAVINNSPLKQTPLYGIIWDSGDEGGDYIFKLNPSK